MIKAELLPSIHMNQLTKKKKTQYEHNGEKQVSGEGRVHCDEC